MNDRTAPRIGLMTWVIALAGCASSGDPTTCQVDTDCPVGRYCQASGDCVFDCTFDTDCPEGFRCNGRGKCERGCAETHHGVEACDGVDNDCDGDTDEDFQVGQPCDNSGCPGSYECQPDGTQACNAPTPAPDDRECDGVDEDCDGDTDEDAAPRPCPLQQGVCAGVQQECLATGSWSECDYGPAFTEGVDALCDRVDSDCDGTADEDAAPVLVPETDSQAADGLDNNCNGLVDEAGGVSVRNPVYAGVYTDAFEIGVFEHPDCSGRQYGVVADDYPAGWPADETASVTLYACSLPGILPSGYLSFHRAKRACEAQGKRPCIKAEWIAACSLELNVSYPYGAAFAQGVCNDGWSGATSLLPTGGKPGCTNGKGTYDMMGNLGEWVHEPYPERAGTSLVGGFSWVCELCSYGESCNPCDRGSEEDWDDFSRASSCLLYDRDTMAFPLAQVRSYFGTRCCIDAP